LLWTQERFCYIARWRAHESGGYLPALEMPGEFVRDLREGLTAALAPSG